jgi:hypothetical protein
MLWGSFVTSTQKVTSASWDIITSSQVIRFLMVTAISSRMNSDLNPINICYQHCMFCAIVHLIPGHYHYVSNVMLIHG